MKIDGVGAIVTGGASGLGEATCRRLAAAGARVAVFDLQARHQERRGEHHVLEFERLAASDGGEDEE